MAQEDSEEISRVFEKKKLPSILGSEDFIDRTRSQSFVRKRHREVAESRILVPNKEEIRELVCPAYGVKEENLLRAKRGTFNEPRNVAINLTRHLRGENLAKICREYGLKTHSSASSAVERVRAQMIKDRRLGRRVDKLTGKLSKGQTET